MSSDNPYQSPDPSPGETARAHSLVLIPAILLLVLAALSILLAVFVGFTIVIDTIRILEYHGSVAGLPHVLPTLAVFTVVAASYVLVFYGSTQMLRFRRLGVAKTAAIIAVIPVCSPLFVLGIPIGIWALIVLSNRDVRAAFQRRATQQSTPAESGIHAGTPSV